MKTLLFSLLIISFQTLASELTVDVTLSPAGSFEAKTTKIIGKVEKSATGYKAEKLAIQIDNFKTGIDLRDDHFKKYLKGEKKVNLIILSKVVATNNAGTGNLKVNEVEKAINFTYKKQSETKIEAVIKLKATDFKLPEANYMGIGVENDVTVKVILDV
jgi:hypothetical protein